MGRFSRMGCVGILVLTGCAMGRTEFKVIRLEPPAPVAQEAEPVPAQHPTPVPEAPAKDQPETQEYIVQPGDSLWRISRRLWNDPQRYRALAQTNALQNPDLIFPGQVLRLPEPVATPTVPAAVPATNKAVSPAVRPGPSAPAPQATATVPVAYPNRPNRAFGPGEALVFSVEYFGISAGSATLSVQPGRAFNGRPTLHLVAEARTHPAFEWFFKVRDRIESYFDAQGLFSWQYEKHLREGSYSNDAKLVYDQPARRVVKENGESVAMPAWSQDVLSEFYYFRTLPLAVGDEVSFPVVADNTKVYEVRVKVLRRETVTVPAGKFTCLVVEPYLKFEGLFQHQGLLHIWVTDDARRVPVLIKSKIVIGTIDIVLRQAVAVDLP